MLFALRFRTFSSVILFDCLNVIAEFAFIVESLCRNEIAIAICF